MSSGDIACAAAPHESSTRSRSAGCTIETIRSVLGSRLGVEAEYPVVLLRPGHLATVEIELETADMRDSLRLGQPPPARLERELRLGLLGDVDRDDPDPDDFVVQRDRVQARQPVPLDFRVSCCPPVERHVDHRFVGVEHMAEQGPELRPKVGGEVGDRSSEKLGNRRSVDGRHRLVHAHDPKVTVDESEPERRGGDHGLEQRQRLRPTGGRRPAGRHPSVARRRCPLRFRST